MTAYDRLWPLVYIYTTTTTTTTTTTAAAAATTDLTDATADLIFPRL